MATEKELKLKIKIDTESGKVEGLSDDINSLGKKTNSTAKEFIHLSDGTKVFQDSMGRLREENGRYVASGKRLDEANKKVGASFKNASKSTDTFKSSLYAIGGAIAGVYAVNKAFDALISTSREFVNTAAQFEQFSTTLQTIEGSSHKAKESMDWITKFASTTPYQLAAVTDNFIKLKAYGIEPTNGTLRVLGDTASAMGKDMGQAVEAMADAVMGENERLKEFGIRASAMGDEIKYSWTNASGEARQAIVQNNSEIIQSTLESIFNSKYEGAMDDQSKTWRGLISNIQDNWTIFQNNIMQSGIFDYLKAIATVAGKYLTEGFDIAKESGVSFSAYVIDGIKSSIESLGYMYDTLEWVGDAFSFAADLGKTAFWGFSSVVSDVTMSIVEGFNWADRKVTDMLNTMIDGYNYVAGALGFGTISHVQYSSVDMTAYERQSAYIDQQYYASKAEMMTSLQDLQTSGGGSDFISGVITKIDETYSQIQNTVSADTQREDFGDSITLDAIENTKAQVQQLQELTTDTAPIEEYVSQIESTIDSQESLTDSLSQTVQVVEDLSDSLYTDNSDEDIYTSVSNVTDSFNDMNTAVNNIDYTTTQAIESIEQFTFAFKDTFLDTITSNASTLYSVGSQKTGYTDISYESALSAALTAKESLIANPFDVGIGKEYEVAFNQLLDSASNYLNPDNFGSSLDYKFASALVGSQVDDLQSTALQGYDVLDSMNTLLTSINQAFADGILTADEKAVISGVATTVNTNNDILLGSSGTIAGTIASQIYYDNTGLATDTNISAQEYYNNAGLATDTNISAQEYYNNAGLATDTNISAQEYYNNAGLALDASVNSIDLDTTSVTTALVGSSSNSVSDFISNLMGSGTQGIAINDVIGTVSGLEVATGLKGSDLANIKTNTYDTAQNTKTGDVSYSRNILDGQGLYSVPDVGNLHARTTTQNFTYDNPKSGDIKEIITFQIPKKYDSDSKTVFYEDYASEYKYYSNGGYTGDGGKYDEAGIVHKGEYVLSQDHLGRVGGVDAVEAFINGDLHKPFIAPVAMVNDNSEVVRTLEKIDKRLEYLEKIEKNTKESRYAS